MEKLLTMLKTYKVAVAATALLTAAGVGAAVVATTASAPQEQTDDAALTAVVSTAELTDSTEAEDGTEVVTLEGATDAAAEDAEEPEAEPETAEEQATEDEQPAEEQPEENAAAPARPARAPAQQASGAANGYRKVTIQPSGDTGLLNYSFNGSGTNGTGHYQKATFFATGSGFSNGSAGLADGSDFSTNTYGWTIQNSDEVDRYIKVAADTITATLANSTRLSCVTSLHVYVVHSDGSKDELLEDGSSSYGTITLKNPTTTANLTISLTKSELADDDDVLIDVEYERTYKNIRSELTFYNPYGSPYQAAKTITYLTSGNEIIHSTYTGARKNSWDISETNYASGVVAVAKDLDAITLKLPSPIFVDSTKVKVYQCDSDGGKTELENITVAVVEPLRDKYLTGAQDAMYLKISGIGNCTDDIIIAAEIKHADCKIAVKLDGYSYSKTAITATAPGYIQYTSYDANSSVSSLNIYSGETYTITHADLSVRLDSAVLTYADADGNIQTQNLTITQSNDGYSVAFTMPFIPGSYRTDTALNQLTLHFTPLRTKVAFNFGKAYMGKLSVTDAVDGAATLFYYSTAKNALTIECENSGRDVTKGLTAGRKYILTNLYDGFDGNRLVLKGFRSYRLQYDPTDYSAYQNTLSSWPLMTDEEGNYIPFDGIAGSGNVYQFTMPDYPIEIFPIYEDHLHRIEVTGDTACQNVGGVTLSATGDNHFFKSSGGNAGTAANASSVWSDVTGSKFKYACDNQTYILTPNFDPSAYRVTDIRAYAYTRYTDFSDNALASSETDKYLVPLTADDITLTNNNDTAGTWTIKLANGLSYRNIQMFVQVEKIPAAFTDFTYVLDGSITSGGIYLNAKFAGDDDAAYSNGKFEFTKYGAVSYGVKETTTTATWAKQIQKNSQITVTLGYDAAQSENNAYRGSRLAYRNLIISLTDEQTNEVLSTFRYFNGNIYELSGTNTSRVSMPETTQHSDDILQTITFQVLVGENPVKLTVRSTDNYIPVTIHQMVIEEDGTVRDATGADGIETTISQFTKNSTARNSLAYKQKYFTSAYREGDYYLATDPSSNYVSSFTVSGAAESRNMLMQYTKLGLLVQPPASGSYVLAGISTETLNRNGSVVATENNYNANTRQYSKLALAPTIEYQSADGANAVYFNENYPLSQQLVVNVYYTEALTSLTVTEYDNTSSSKNKVVLSNYNTERDEPTMPYLLDRVDQYETYTINKTANSAGVSTNFSVNRDTGIQFEITPISTRNISEVRAYKLLANGVEQELEVERVSGSAYPGEKTTYQIVNYLATPGDDIHVAIIYDYMQRLTVRVMMLDDANKLVPNQSDVRVNVTGTVTDGSNVFWRGENQLVAGNTIEVGAYDETTKKSEDSVYVAPNAKIDLETKLNDSDYRIANVVAYQIDNNGNTKGDPIALTYSRTKSAGQDGEGGGIDFSLSTLPSMPVGQNVLITVYLARPVNMTVTIKTENDDGIDVDGAPVDSYVNVYGKNSQIGANEYTIVTEPSEGGFNTKSITITDNPATRTVQIFQGSTLEAFANALLQDNWVIKKVTVTDKDGNEVGNLYTGESSQVTAEDTRLTYLRVKFGTRQQFLPNNNYTVTVYLAKAKSVFVTTSITNSTFASPTQAGSVEVYGENADIDTILFTRINPTGTISANHYDAINTKRSDSYGYRSETKCIAQTEITVKVKPKNSNYIVGSFTATVGNGLSDLVCTPSEPDEDGVITYTLTYADGSAFTMNKAADLYINVEFTPVTSSKVTIDYWYTDDYKTMKPAPGSEVATAYIEQHYGSSVYPNEPTVYDAENGVWVSGFRDIQENGTYDVLVGTRLYLGVHLINGNIYAPIENWIERTDTATGKTTREASYAMPTNGVNQDVSVKAGEDLFCHILLAPVSVIDFTQRDRNVVGDSPIGTDAIATTCYNNTKYCPEAKMELELDADLAAAVASGLERDGALVSINHSIYGSMFHKNHYTNELTENTSNVVVFQGSNNLTVSLHKDWVKPGEVVSVKAYDGDTLVATLTETVEGVYTAPDSFVIAANKHYKVVVTMDCVDTWTSLNVTGEDAGVYLVTPRTADQDVKTIDIYNSDTYGMLKQIKFGTGREQYRLDETWRNVTGPVYVIVQVSQPSGELNLDVAEWRDYYDDYAKDGKFDQKGGVKVKSEMLANYFTVQDGNGFDRYCYAFQITPEYPEGNNPCPLDNSQYFAFSFFTPKTPSVHDQEDTPATVILWQEKRTSNSDYVKTTDGTAVMTLADGSQFTYEGESVSSVQAPGHNGQESVVQANTVVGKSIRLQVTPPENCIVTKVVVTDDNGVHEYKPNKDNIYNIQVSFAKEEIVVYYSWPQITVSTNNKTGDEKGTVWKDAVTPDNTDNLIVDSGVYMGSTLVEKGVNKQLVIEPKTYETENGVEDYQVAYVLVGRDGRNSMLPISSDLIVPDKDGRITVELGEINTDVDVHVQFARKTEAKTLTLIVSHFVWDGSDWIPCNTTYHGTVTTVGTLEGVEDPILDENDNPANPLVLEEDPSVTATVVQGTKLDFTAKPAELFLVDHINIRLNGESLVPVNGTTVPGAERTFPLKAENYSVIYVDVYYKEPVYTVTYHANIDGYTGAVPQDVDGEGSQNTYYYRQEVTVLDKGTLAHPKYEFVGWTTVAGGTVADPSCAPGRTFQITSDTDLYAVWEKKTPYKLVYKYKDRYDNDKQYIAFVWLASDEIEDGSPTVRVLKDNAPYITDLYKTCRWDFESAETENRTTTTIMAVQTEIKHKIFWDSTDTRIDTNGIEEELGANAMSVETLTVKEDEELTCNMVYQFYNKRCPLVAAETDEEGGAFLYWRATDVKDGKLVEGTSKPVCYTREYNYRITKDIYVEPVYRTNDSDFNKDWDVTLGETVYGREQYTDDDQLETHEDGEEGYKDGEQPKDYVYADYLLSILSPTQELVDAINNTQTNENSIASVQFGIVLERDTTYVYDDTTQAVKYPSVEGQDETDQREAIRTLLDGKKEKIQPGKTYKLTAEDENREYRIYDRTSSSDLLTNKNRIDVYIKIENLELNRQHSYNVYAYLIVVDGNGNRTVIISEDISHLSIYEYGEKKYVDEDFAAKAPRRLAPANDSADAEVLPDTETTAPVETEETPTAEPVLDPVTPPEPVTDETGGENAGEPADADEPDETVDDENVSDTAAPADTAVPDEPQAEPEPEPIEETSDTHSEEMEEADDTAAQPEEPDAADDTDEAAEEVPQD